MSRHTLVLTGFFFFLFRRVEPKRRLTGHREAAKEEGRVAEETRSAGAQRASRTGGATTLGRGRYGPRLATGAGKCDGGPRRRGGLGPGQVSSLQSDVQRGGCRKAYALVRGPTAERGQPAEQ